MKVNPGDPDATIVIFGAAVRPDGGPSGTLRNRVAAAARLGSRFKRPLFIPTGGEGRFGDLRLPQHLPPVAMPAAVAARRHPRASLSAPAGAGRQQPMAPVVLA